MKINYERIPAHCRDGVRMYIEQGIPPGGFLRAVLSNDLAGAVARADGTNAPRLKDYIMFLYNEAPSNCWGSPEVVDAWIKVRGLERRR